MSEKGPIEKAWDEYAGKTNTKPGRHATDLMPIDLAFIYSKQAFVAGYMEGMLQAQQEMSDAFGKSLEATAQSLSDESSEILEKNQVEGAKLRDFIQSINSIGNGDFSFKHN